MINHKKYMKYAIKLAKKGIFTTSSNPIVGCVIVNNKIIVGQGWHQKRGSEHAEIIALNMAKKLSYGATMYVTLEPCAHYGLTGPCYKKIISSGIYKIFISTKDPNPKVNGKSIKKLKKSGIKVNIGLLKKKSKFLNREFFKWIKTGNPWINLKIAMSLDGKIATQSGKSKWITSKKSRNEVHKLRAQNTAILTTSKTVLQDNPLLNVRVQDMNILDQKKFPKENFVQPIRIIIDSKNRIQKNHKIIQITNKILLIRLKSDNKKWPKHVKQIIIPPYKNKINLILLFKFLGTLNIKNILVESGSLFASSLLSLNIIDELIIYCAPIILGNNSKPIFLLNYIKKISQSKKIIFRKVFKIGNDLCMKINFKKSSK
ncbi:bifunctional diaminohydroxyphosphoribosylaminopyrimidine deaminase/5-amino-6-(5-phosphoribosylamino)uracil reductase RibD [Buchnera aphidicola]|uniref:bifunctional diaminohydroxyphosphoribosylaminopyrimidine deaminase/5-amino-6-(5-phosphoribosylamino)uracil reductase RibD n=1 Tax=Buchnera aphidicola TaxID=9 RepID=UPI0022380709|nr:bifunctional diaminohydroxyphosphoribosylaminopyrimidine deaminase/5-amino-6-(5-phosphoribosylamino)uracil reductase RibD [Buchnera aphidicola]MCW5197533.1 bifunctional diaminohydroxyphosphoribosylaminopyrimidine deaminase/5-amino-6-(5-phosphoribosylamino)uracil reductase RibD [Buchnera aphidicola (Chaitophorus viminalis)]